MKIKILSLSVLAVLAFACGESHKDHDHSAEDHSAHAGHDHGDSATEAEHEHEGSIFLSEEQATQLGLTYVTVEPRSFSGVIRTSGVIEPAPGDAATIVATAPGTISFAGTRFSEGVAVGRGIALFTIRSGDMADNNLTSRIAEAQALLRKAQADHDRIETLYKDRLATSSQMEDARLALDQARVAAGTLERNTSSAGVRTIASPIAGYITSLAVRDGDYVSEGAALATVSANRNLVLRADLPLRHFAQASSIASSNFLTPYDGKVYDIAELGGRLISTAQSTAAESSYTLPVRFSIENRSQFIPGSVVEVYLKTAPRAGALTVPVTAVTEDGGAKYVYLRSCEEAYDKHLVTTGVSDGREVEILSGIAPGNVVVATGAYFVKLASMSSEIPHGHSH